MLVSARPPQGSSISLEGSPTELPPGTLVIGREHEVVSASDPFTMDTVLTGAHSGDKRRHDGSLRARRRRRRRSNARGQLSTS